MARAHLERLSYFVHNDAITAETFYDPLMRHCLQAFEGEAVVLTLDTSMLWDQFCLIQVCLAWEGRAFAWALLSEEPSSLAKAEVALVTALALQRSASCLGLGAQTFHLRHHDQFL